MFEVKKIILTAHHKNDAAIPVFKKYFYPIQVGSALNEADLGIERDDTGENISNKNKNYCELTAYYFAYKNLDFDYAGLMHYRRIFSVRNFRFLDIKSYLVFFAKRVIDVFSIKDINLCLDNNFKIYSLGDLEEECRSFNDFLKEEDFDIILPKKVLYAYLGMKNQYAINHCANHFQTFNEIIIKKYPKFSDVINHVNQSKTIYPYNMFVMKREIFLDYHKILFDVLTEMEKYVDLDAMNSYQSRIFGFLSERFLNYYIAFLRKESQVRIKELRINFITDTVI